MQVLLLLMFLTVTLFAQEKYSIQVLSVENNASITQDFMQKVKQTGMPYTIQTMKNAKQRICLGEFTKRKEADKVLKEIQRQVSKDAFVCKAEGSAQILMEPKQKMQHAIVMAKARTLKTVKKDESKIEVKALKNIESIEVEGLIQKTNIPKVNPRRAVPLEKEVKTEETVSKKISPSLFCKPTKRLLREQEISTALSFYKNSSYYTFGNGLGI